MRHLRSVALMGVILLGFAMSKPACAQDKGEPGKFDFFLLNLSWSPEFCSIQGTSPQCAAHPGFIVHGLWPQNNNGTYPVFCAERAGPQKPEANLDITPDLPLLQHEWDKHGTCTTASPEAFFGMEHKAFQGLVIPKLFRDLDREVLLKPDEILDLLQKANPAYPAGSLVVSCGHNRLTAIEACLAKDDLRPIVCSNVPGCHAQVVRIVPQQAATP